MGYSETYPPLGVAACQAAARLLPGDAAAHYVLAEFYLSALRKNPSLETLQPVWVELKIGQELEAIQTPSELVLGDCRDYASNWECLSAMIANIFPGTPNPEWYSSVSEYITSEVDRMAKNATATAVRAARLAKNETATAAWAARLAENATQAAKASTWIAQRSATLPPTQTPTYTLTPAPSITPLPTLTVTFTLTLPAASPGVGQGIILGGAIIVIVLVIVVVLFIKRLRSAG